MALGRPGSLLRELATMAIVCAMGLAGVLLLVWLVKVISRSGVHGIIAVP